MIGKFLAGMVAVTAMVFGETTEEETWYGADGKVVKTVKRTLTGAEARKSADWEPVWVIRERRRSTARPLRYSSSNWRGYGSRYGGYGGYWGGSYYLGRAYLAPRTCGATGFKGRYRTGSGWGFSYRSPGLSVRSCR